MWIAWVREKGKWLRVGQGILRRSAVERADEYPADVERVALRDGQPPNGPTLIKQGEHPDWDTWDEKSWGDGPCPF